MPATVISVSREIAALRRSLRALDRSMRRLAPKLNKAARGGVALSPERAPRRLNLSSKRRAQLKIQGKYMATIRQLRPRQKAEVREILQKRGMSAAIARAETLMKKDRAA